MSRRRAVAWALVALLAVVAGAAAASELRSLRNDIAASERLTEVERADGGSRHLALDPSALVRLEQVLPEDATYAIVVGADVDPPSPLTPQGIRQLLRYRLLPRRNVDSGAEWVVSYGGGVALPGGPVDFSVPPFEIVRVRP